jgi:NAD+ kinase
MSEPIRTVAVVAKPGVAEAAQDLQRLRKLAPELDLLIEREGHHARIELPEGVQRVSAEELAERADLVVVLGGDGTFIHAASLLNERVVPILGVNLGHIGFLTEVTRDELPEAFARARRGELPYSDRMRLDVEIRRNDKVISRHRVLNDAVLAPQAMARISSYRIRYGGELVTTLRGDGVIVATPTGSTAYAMAAGASIVSPDLDAVLVVPICPHQLSQRPLVLSAKREVELSLESEGAVFATCEGQSGQEFRRGDVMLLRRAPVPTRILGQPGRSFFQTLREKLRWGA